MLANQVIKYKIWEWCIDALFDGINRNFQDIPEEGVLWAKGRYWTREEIYALSKQERNSVIWDAFQNGRNEFLFTPLGK